MPQCQGALRRWMTRRASLWKRRRPAGASADTAVGGSRCEANIALPSTVDVNSACGSPFDSHRSSAFPDGEVPDRPVPEHRSCPTRGITVLQRGARNALHTSCTGSRGFSRPAEVRKPVACRVSLVITPHVERPCAVCHRSPAQARQSPVAMAWDTQQAAWERLYLSRDLHDDRNRGLLWLAAVTLIALWATGALNPPAHDPLDAGA